MFTNQLLNHQNLTTHTRLKLRSSASVDSTQLEQVSVPPSTLNLTQLSWHKLLKTLPLIAIPMIDITSMSVY